MLHPESSALVGVSVRFGTPRRALDGRLVSAGAGTAQIELLEAPPPELSPGTEVELRPDGPRPLDLLGIVTRVLSTRLEVTLTLARQRDDRYSPRERGELRFRLRPAPADLDLDAWVAGDPSPPGPWTEPDPRVELSLTGLAYLDSNPPDGAVLLAFVHEGVERRLVARVVRTDPTRREGMSRVSLEFSRPPEPSGTALAEILLAWQDEALDAFVGASTLDLPSPDVANLDPW